VAGLKEAMMKVNWARVYQAYFYNMVIRGLTGFARNAIGVEAGFNAVARIIESGSMRCFDVLREELAKAGLGLPEKVDLEQVLGYEVKCHGYSVEAMGVSFQVWEKYRREGDKHMLETERCIYLEEARRNPLVCAVCVGLTSGILKKFGFRVQFLRHPSSAKRLCLVEEARRPEYIVYRDPEVGLPACRLVVEKLKC